MLDGGVGEAPEAKSGAGNENGGEEEQFARCDGRRQGDRGTERWRDGAMLGLSRRLVRRFGFQWHDGRLLSTKYSVLCTKYYSFRLGRRCRSHSEGLSQSDFSVST